MYISRQISDKKGIFRNKECTGKPSRSCSCNGCHCRNGEWVATTRMACGDKGKIDLLNHCFNYSSDIFVDN